MAIKPKRLKGVDYVPELESLCQKALALNTTATDKSSFDDEPSSVTAKALSLISVTKAKEIIEQISWDEVKNQSVFPLCAVRALKSLITNSSESDDYKKELSSDLEATLARTSLSFTKPSTVLDGVDEERKRYLERVVMLRLKAEERKYSKLTSNIDKRKKEDAGTRTMTYAASVGLNMIVAPLSFGAFCYFFSGNIFGWIDYYTENEKIKDDDIDIRRVIIGVIAGVAMMFIEMILFVIRSHELDAHVRKKEKKKNLNAFGYDKNNKNNERNFIGDAYS